MNYTSTSAKQLRVQDGFALFISSLIGIVANVFACVVSGKLLKKQPLTPNLFVLVLSCINLAVLVLSCFPSWLSFFFGRWRGGARMCTFQGVMFLFASISAGAIGALLSTDRCVAVVKPLLHKRCMTIERAKLLIAFVSVTSLAFSLLPLAGFGKIRISPSSTFCSVGSSSARRADRAFVLLYTVLGCLLVLATVLPNFLVILTLVKRKRHRINVLQPRFLAARRREREEIDVQFAKMMVVLSVILLVSWLPYAVRLIGSTFYGWHNESADLLVFRMLLLSLTLDPFTYVLTRKHYRGLIREMILCRWFRCLQSRPHVTSKGRMSSASSSNMTTRNNSEDSPAIPLDQMQYDAAAAYVVPQLNVIPPPKH